jgi:hypothetical protein
MQLDYMGRSYPWYTHLDLENGEKNVHLTQKYPLTGLHGITIQKQFEQ